MEQTDVVSEGLIEAIQSKLGTHIREAGVSLGHPVIRTDRADIAAVFPILKNDTDLAMNLFLSVTAVDWVDSAAERFEVVYHLLSLKHNHRLRIKVWVPEKNAEVDSVAHLWEGANFMEREIWDMYGISFRGHPDQRRILLYEEFVGHPLRKDYPLQAKQPRIKLRAPEVRNTAVDMVRPTLVSINPRKH